MPKKRSTIFKKEWAGLVPDGDKWLKESSRGETFACCSLCNVDINVTQGGISVVKQHSHAATHINKLKIKNTLAPVGNFFSLVKRSDVHSAKERKIMEAELRWVLHTVEANKSFNSEDNVNQLFMVMFDDSHLAKKFACGRTKSTYLLMFALLPYIKSKIDESLSTSFYSTSFDESDGKMSVVTRSINHEDGAVEINLLDVVALEEFTAEASANSILKAIDTAKLRKSHWIGDESDNCNTMRGMCMILVEYIDINILVCHFINIYIILLFYL